jgi:Family of unknown function (DUF6454)
MLAAARALLVLCLGMSQVAIVDAQPAATPIKTEVIDWQHIDYPTHHVQGLAATADSYWITSVDRAAKRGHVYRVDRATGKVTTERELTLGTQFHPGGIDWAAGALWVPVAEYRARSTSTILKLDPTSLAALAAFTIDDHIGCLTIVDNGEILAANWDARTFHRFNADGKKLGELANPRPAKYQDLKTLDGHIVASGTEPLDGKQVPVVDRLNPKTLALVSRWQPTGTLRTGGSNFCREGCAIFAGQLLLMPEDGPETTIYRFAVPTR